MKLSSRFPRGTKFAVQVNHQAPGAPGIPIVADEVPEQEH